MKIIDVAIKEIRPYKNNPRDNTEAVEYVKNSIEAFGFKQPLVLDKNKIIVCGHTRYAAAQELGLKKVPCLIADDLTDDEIKAYRLADNKVAEMAEWDPDLLDLELDDLKLAFDMSEFAFDFDVLVPDIGEEETEEGKDIPNDMEAVSGPASDEEENDKTDDGYYGDARESTYNAYLLYDYDASQASGWYDMPILTAEEHIPERLIGFNYVLSTDDFDAGVHFYLDDYQFERIWNRPYQYMDRLSQFDCVLTPDFSLYIDMPMAMKIWNTYRSRLIGQIMQRQGIKVIPTLSWAEPETFNFCFDGIEPGGVVSVSTIGVKRDKEATKIWIAGMDEAMRRLKPACVLVYGGDIGYDFGETKAVHIVNEVQQRWKERGKE